MSIYEIGMLACFGAAWPMNIYKSWNARTSKGKSFPFLLTIAVGYVCGIINKILFHNDIVLYLYLINLLMVAVDIALYFRNKHLDRLANA